MKNKSELYFRVTAFAKNHSTVLQNFTYMSVLEVFLLLAPIITYPYLTKVIGLELFGVILTAQMLASYATLIIDFGSNSICARFVSINRENNEKLSEIVCSVLCARFSLFILCFLVYIAVVLIIPIYRDYLWLFFLTYGLTISDVVFPRYYFQGIEHMKVITIVSIVTKLVFIFLIFTTVKDQSDYLLVPVLYAIGYALGGIISLYIVFIKNGLHFYVPPFKDMWFYVKESSPVFGTELVSTIKDKFNYMLIGLYVGMESIVIYDLGLKINGLIGKPMTIINTVMFPRFSKSRDLSRFKQLLFIILIAVVCVVLLANIFLPYIVEFFIHKQVDLLPIRIFFLAPVMVAVSGLISQNLFLAFGYNKYVFYSIIVTTITYIILLLVLMATHNLGSLYSFIILALVSYFVEMVYRLYVSRKIFKLERHR